MEYVHFGNVQVIFSAKRILEVFFIFQINFTDGHMDRRMDGQTDGQLDQTIYTSETRADLKS